MESRRPRVARKSKRGVSQQLTVQNPAATLLSLPHIEDLIAYGDVTIGILRPIGCVATAAHEDRCLAMLVRRRGETLGQFLTRLDRAIEKAINEDVFTDEINPPHS